MANPTEETSTKTETELHGWNGTTWREVRLDSSTRALPTLTYVHHEIRAGDHFKVHNVVDIAINTVYDVLITTPNTTKYAHFFFSIDPENECEWYFYRNVSASVTGTTIAAYNSNHNSSTTNTTTLKGFASNSVASANLKVHSTGSTQIYHGIIGSKTLRGGEHGHDDEDMLQQNKKYLLRFIANAAGYINYHLDWYEHTDLNETGAVW